MIAYHDLEWGVPLRDDNKLFEFLVLETFQAGLSWMTVLRKRDAFRAAYDGFDPVKVAAYGTKEVDRLLANAGIIRNRAKINASITNAQAFLKIVEQEGSFSDWSWRFVDGRSIRNEFKKDGDIPAVSPEAERFSTALRARGFKFVGPTVVYAHMQATGMVNDHLVHCFRYKEIEATVDR